MTTINLHSYEKHIRETIHLSMPVVIGQLGNILMGVIDNLMIGDLGYNYLSAASFANGVFFIIIVFGMGITFAISPLVAEADAQGDTEMSESYLRQSIWIAIGSSAILGLLIYGSSFLFPYMNQPEEDVVLAQPYMEILSFSFMPMMLFLVFKQFADGLSVTIAAMQITLLGLVFNTFANWLLIYGNWGFPTLELNGAGYATLGSRIFMMVLMILYVAKSKRFEQYHPFRNLFSWHIPTIRKIIAIGLPSGLQFFFEVGAFAGAAIMVGWIGAPERAAHQIVISLAATTYMFSSGIAAGTSIRVGNALGRKDMLNVERAGYTGIFLSAVFMLTMALVFVIGKNFFPSFFIDDPYVLEIAATLMLIGAFFQLFDGVQVVALGALRGIQDVRIPTIITFIAYWVIALPVGYSLAFVFDMGVNGLWYSFVVGLGFAAIFLVWRFWKMNRGKANIFEEDEYVANQEVQSEMEVF